MLSYVGSQTWRRAIWTWNANIFLEYFNKNVFCFWCLLIKYLGCGSIRYSPFPTLRAQRSYFLFV